MTIFSTLTTLNHHRTHTNWPVYFSSWPSDQCSTSIDPHVRLFGLSSAYGPSANMEGVVHPRGEQLFMLGRACISVVGIEQASPATVQAMHLMGTYILNDKRM